MAQLFDPSAPMDFASQQARIAQQQKLVEMLRKQGAQIPEGKMVGDHYVAPHWSQQLAAFGNTALGTYVDMKNQGAEKELMKQQAAAANQWRSSLPQATGGVSPPAELGGGPPTPVQSVTREAILKHALAGMSNPLTAKEAPIIADSLTSGLTRDEDMKFRDEQARTAALERADGRREQLQAKSEEIALRLQDRALDRSSREDLTRMQDATRREIAAMNNATRAQLAALHKSGGSDIAARAAELATEKLSRRAEPIAPMTTAAQMVQDMLDSYKQPDGKTKSIPGVGLLVGSLPPGMISTEGATNRQKIQMFANAMLRAQAGLSQTLSEQEKATLELMSNGKFRQEQFEATWPSLMEKVNATTKAITSGYTPDVVESFKQRGGGLELVGSKAKKSTTAPKWKVEVE